MGREIKRVALDFDFPVGQGFADWAYSQHEPVCPDRDDDGNCGCGFSWNDMVPKGEGWQLWQTVSDGPISPVFATPEELIDFMCRPDLSGRLARGYSPWDCGWDRAVAEHFVRSTGWAPSMVIAGGQMMDGATFHYLSRQDKEEP